MTPTWLSPPGAGTELSMVLTAGKAALKEQGTRPCPGAPAGDPEEARTVAGHSPPTSQRAGNGRPGPPQVPGLSWGARVDHTHGHAPLASAQRLSRGGTQVRGGGCPPRRKLKGAPWSHACSSPLTAQHPFPLQGLSPRPVLVGMRGSL